MKEKKWWEDRPQESRQVAGWPLVSGDTHAVATLRTLAERRRRQGEKIKQCICNRPTGPVVTRLLREMAQKYGVHVHVHDLEEPGCRLIWKVTFDYETPWGYRYFLLRRLFGGKALDPTGTHYLGPYWEAPLACLNWAEETLAQCLEPEEIEIRSGVGVETVRVGEPDWEATLREKLLEAYHHPLRKEAGEALKMRIVQMPHGTYMVTYPRGEKNRQQRQGRNHGEGSVNRSTSTAYVGG